MGTGENEQALRKIMDFTRMLSIAILIIHIYLSCYIFFKEIGFSSTITDKILVNISKTTVYLLQNLGCLVQDLQL